MSISFPPWSPNHTPPAPAPAAYNPVVAPTLNAPPAGMGLGRRAPPAVPPPQVDAANVPQEGVIPVAGVTWSDRPLLVIGTDKGFNEEWGSQGSSGRWVVTFAGVPGEEHAKYCASRTGIPVVALPDASWRVYVDRRDAAQGILADASDLIRRHGWRVLVHIAPEMGVTTILRDQTRATGAGKPERLPFYVVALGTAASPRIVPILDDETGEIIELRVLLRG